MRTGETRLSGPIVLEPTMHADERGFFLETYSARDYAALGIDAPFLQDNHSRSGAGVLRGLHFQQEPGQGKLVRVARGRVVDVVVDLRRSSPTFGQHEVFELDDVSHRQVYVPVGFAHGFVVLSEVADVVYKVTAYYDPTTERGIVWDDPDLAIAWPVTRPRLSPRDRELPRLAEIRDRLPDW